MDFGYKSLAAQRERTIREQQLPQWAHGLPALVQGALLDAELPDLSIETVRAYGAKNWLGRPNLGHLGVLRLGEAIGGWMEHTTPGLSTFSDADLVMEMLRRGFCVRLGSRRASNGAD